MFNFKDVSVERKSFVGYGVNHDVTIVGVESGTSQNDTEFVQLKVKNTGDKDDNSTILKMYFSEKARPITMRKIMTIHNAVAKMDLLKSKSFNTTDELAQGLNAMWSGRRFRLKLQASEYAGEDADGNAKTKVRTEIPIANFAEAITEGAEMDVTAKENTKLTFNDKDKWDYRRLKVETDSTENEFGGKGDLPF